MITLPIDLGWLIVAVVILIPALTYLAATEAEHAYTRAYRRDMKAREIELSEGWKQLEKERLKLGRAAHDMSTQAKLAVHQAMDDTAISMPRFED